MEGVSRYVEETLYDILERFRAAAGSAYGIREPALGLAAPLLLQDAARAARSDGNRGREPEPWRRSVLLIASQPEGGIRGLLREFGLLRRALWEALSSRHHAVASDERRRIDLFLDEAAALAADRWVALARALPFQSQSLSLVPPPETEEEPLLPPPLPPTVAAETGP